MVYSLAGNMAGRWKGDGRGSLIRESYTGERYTSIIRLFRLSRADAGLRARPSGGRLWIGLDKGGGGEGETRIKEDK